MPRFDRAVSVALYLGAALALGCGGSNAGPNPPPAPPPAPPPPPPPPAPTPAVLAKQGGDNQTAEPGQAVAIAPSVKVTSSSGAAVSGVVVTFAVASGGGTVTGATPTTGADGVAAVGSWTLGSSEGPNTLTATIAGTGITGNPATFTATSRLPAFAPTSNTTLTGTRNFSSLNIPAGVTVTATGDLTITTSGAATIAGTLSGNCVAISLTATGALTLSGTLNNGCTGAVPATVPAVTLVGRGGYNLNGATVTAAGDFKVTDDPSATDADFAPPIGGPPAQLRAGGAKMGVGVPCTVGNFVGNANPNPMTPNNVGGSPNGTDGGDGKTWTLWCKGGGDITVGLLSLTGQSGGRGGDGTHQSATAAVSRGGKGGKGGDVKIQSKGNLQIGGGSSITTGAGGDGGHATATGTGAGGNVGASADATGGAGGAPGLFKATAAGSITIAGALTISIGRGGRGGDATATGGNGHNAEPCPAAAGGPATATAGNGGSTPDKQLTAQGAVNGLGNVTVAGGQPGNGGNATATAGKGGDGAKPCKDGAVGGVPRARGGDGGNGELRNQSGTRIANGGNGGNMTDANAKGGQGWNDCILPTFEPGGRGGNGGRSEGANGVGGTGFQSGTNGSLTFNMVSNAGNGGDGLGPGAGGTKGENGALIIGNPAVNIIQPSFQDGMPGRICVGTFTKTFTFAAPTSDQDGHEPVLQQTGGRQAQVTIGGQMGDPSSSMTINGLIKNSTISLSGTRNGSNFTLTGTGQINTQFGPRNVTVTFTGTIGPNGISGTVTITVQGYANPAVYPVTDP